MRLGDLPADRQAETGVLAEVLAFGTVGVEALEDPVDVLGANAGPVVLDLDDCTCCARAPGAP